MKSADAANTYLKLSGGTMTGNIRYKGSKNTYDMITFVDNNVGTYGNGICIGGGGLTIIGGGESASNVLKQHTNGGDENMIVANDAAIDFFSNMNSGWDSRKAGSFDTSGYWNGVGFKKNNSNDNYVLTGGGGHKAISTLSVSYASSAGSATKLQNSRTINGTSFNGTANIVTSYWGTTRKLWGNSVNGNADVNGSITIANTDGVYVQIGDVRLVYDKANTAIKVVKSDGTTAANFYATGGITAYSSSDIRLKQDLRKLDYLGIIKAMGGTFGFAWKKDNTRSIGWIAQHVLCNPHLKDIVETDEKGYYKINYWSPKLIATAFGAIEQVGDEVSRLKARVVFLESEVQRLSGKQDGNNKKRLDNKNINLLN